MAQKTRPQLLAEIAAQLATNGSGHITAAVLRGVENDMTDSVWMPLTDGVPALANAVATALGLKADKDNPLFTTALNVDGMVGQLFSVTENAVVPFVPFIEQPITIGDTDPTVLDILTTVVYYNRADAQAIVVAAVADTFNGQSLVVSNNINLPVNLTAVAGSSFFNGSPGVVSSIVLAARETIRLTNIGNLWRVAARYTVVVSNGSSGGGYPGEVVSLGGASSGHVPLGNGSGQLDLSWFKASGATPGAYSNPNVTVDNYGRVTAISNGSGGGGSSDRLSTLTGAEISITTTATATISRMHVISGTGANYTVTLPAVSGNTGKFIGFRVASNATKLFTLDGNGTETIDGALTRIMWANETCELYCDGTTWTKVAGKTIPMNVKLQRQLSNQSVPGASSAAIGMDTKFSGVDAMYDSVNGRVAIVRPGTYIVTSFAYLSAGTSIAVGNALNAASNASNTNNGFALASTVDSGAAFTNSFDCAAGDYINTWVYAFTLTATILASPGVTPQTNVVEQPTW